MYNSESSATKSIKQNKKPLESDFSPGQVKKLSDSVSANSQSLILNLVKPISDGSASEDPDCVVLWQYCVLNRESKALSEMMDGIEPPNGSVMETLPEGGDVLLPAREGSRLLPFSCCTRKRWTWGSWAEVQTEETMGKEKWIKTDSFWDFVGTLPLKSLVCVWLVPAFNSNIKRLDKVIYCSTLRMLRA